MLNEYNCKEEITWNQQLRTVVKIYVKQLGIPFNINVWDLGEGMHTSAGDGTRFSNAYHH